MNALAAVVPASVLAAALAGAAVWWALLGAGAGLGRLAAEPATPGAVVRRSTWLRLMLLAASVLVAVALLAGPGAAAICLALGQVAGCAWWLSRRRAARRALVEGRTAVVHAGELVAGLLRVGRIPAAALTEAAVDAPVLRAAAAELAAGGEAAAALRRTASGVGHEGLAELASAWEVSVRTGGSLVSAVDAASARLAAADDVARVVEAELSAARLGGRVMAALPLIGLGLGFAVGGNPLAFLTGSPGGWVCLNLGVVLACAGVIWIDRVAERAGGR
ncbi:MAG: hypothetical protein Q4F65_01490 [Propionibacteriaceae bacterium]|nr:hypothetical protein [Propionibacteriaceae bacterium]